MEEETQDEYSIVDRAGRIQIPRNMLDTLELKGNKIKVTMDEKTIMLKNPDDNAE